MKVYLSEYGPCGYNSLQEIVDYKLGLGHSYLDHVIQYNVRYRDCLREKGMDGLLEMLFDECPRLAREETVLNNLKNWWVNGMHEHLADYDIQCYPRDARLNIAGSWFDGVDDVKAQVEMSGRTSKPIFEFLMDSRWSRREKYKENPDGLHIGELWESYPTFDSSDAGDGRSYDNYFFSRSPLTVAMMDCYSEIDKEANKCMVHEYIPKDALPVLYCNGDYPCVLLASEK